MSRIDEMNVRINDRLTIDPRGIIAAGGRLAKRPSKYIQSNSRRDSAASNGAPTIKPH
ncbi:MAG: hypothetical protein Aurels2KO_26450 [Aureliella sp.]